MSTPTFIGPDSVARTELVFSTNSGSRFFYGSPGIANAVGMEVSINGSAWSNDPDLIVFDGSAWTVPNPSAYPSGLSFMVGANTVRVRALSASGSVSGTASATVTYVRGLSLAAPAPTNISVQRQDGAVTIYAEPAAVLAGTAQFSGMNFYAAAAGGGGVSGYYRINLTTVSTGTTVEATQRIAQVEDEFLVAVNPDGSHAADPLYLYVTGTQRDAAATVLTTDFNRIVGVPEDASRLRTSVGIDTVRSFTQYSFVHDRNARETSNPPTVYVSSFAVLNVDEPLYYVVSAVYFDPNTQSEIESAFGAEVAGNPLRVAAQVGEFPIVSRQQIVRDTIGAIFRSNPQIQVGPGSVLRDTFIDPFANEAERIRFAVDFLHRAQSFAGLLAVDDPNNTGVSVAVASSPYKTALKAAFRLVDDETTQNLIDRSFEALASNFGVFRSAGKQARGEVTFYTTRRPAESIIIPVGTLVSAGSVAFTVTQGAVISLNQLSSYYNPVNGRYSVTVAVQATVAGAAGNVTAGQVRRIVSGPTSLSVTNSGGMFGGTNRQSNKELAYTARNALASVDSGTRIGYLQVAAGVPGVLRANVVAAGDVLMQRDLYDGTHIGGKVDVWVQGSAESTVTDVFAFQYDTVKDMQFVLVGGPSSLTFRALDSNLSENAPIVQLLDQTGLGYSFRNASTGFNFDLANAVITQYNTIQLDVGIAQPSVSLTDVVLGDYRRGTGNDYVFRRQPVTSLVSVVGSLSGPLSADQTRLYHPDSPTLNGGSIRAVDFLRVIPENGVPSGGMLQVLDESHVLVGEYAVFLDSLGVDELTIVVTDTDGNVFGTTGNPDGYYDYAIIPGDFVTATAIVRVPDGRIADGQSVLASYQHGENFTVTYAVDQIPSQVQQVVDLRKHVTADVLVKAAVPWTVDVVATVVLSQGASRARVDTALRTAVAAFFEGLRLGEPVRQSDLIAVMEGVSGVSYVVVPFTQLSTAEGTTIVQDPIRSTDAGDAIFLSKWSTPTVSVWMLTDPLTAIPVDGGGLPENFHAIYQDTALLEMVASSPSTELRRAIHRGYISGADGLIIPGLSDTATLMAQGYLTEAEVLEARSMRTGSRVFVSMPTDDAPSEHNFAATYQAGQDFRVYNIDPGDAQYVRLNPDNGLTLTFSEV